jgi:hypothetical protein
MKTIKNLLLVLGFGLLGATATAQNPETGALMTDPNVGCAYGYGQYGYMNCGGGSGGSSGSAQPQPPKIINRYGAVAVGKKGFDSSYNQSSQDDASKTALSKCGDGCSILATYKNQCVGLVSGKKNGGSLLFLGYSLKENIAQNNAFKNCSKTAKNCKLIAVECSKYK